MQKQKIDSEMGKSEIVLRLLATLLAIGLSMYFSDKGLYWVEAKYGIIDFENEHALIAIVVMLGCALIPFWKVYVWCLEQAAKDTKPN